jgi:carbon catabolite-derepressing protein kinase
MLTFLSSNESNFDNGSDDGGSLHHADSMLSQEGSKSSDNNAHRSGSGYKLPADPWVLQVRWRQDGMYPPGTVPPGSTHSSQLDLRRQSVASLSSTGGSAPSHDAINSTKNSLPDPQDGVVMHLDIQLYEMEPNVYLVDFKCAGYETAEGAMLEEKDVTSPFPFLDLASQLIIQLAEAE